MRYYQAAGTLLSVLGVAAISAPSVESPCRMNVSRLWVEEPYGHWVLNPLCGGTCPSSQYNCVADTIGFGSGEPGWTETCRCKDAQGGFAPNPPCSGTVGFDPDLFGPGLGGYYIIGCDPEENCGTLTHPRECEQQFWDIEECPVSPFEQALCLCEPL